MGSEEGRGVGGSRSTGFTEMTSIMRSFHPDEEQACLTFRVLVSLCHEKKFCSPAVQVLSCFVVCLSR